MKTTIGIAIALMFGCSAAYAQDGPGEKIQGAPGMHEQGPGGPGMRGVSPAPNVPQRVEPRSVERSEPKSNAGRDVQQNRQEDGRHAQQNREEKASKSKNDQPQRAERDDKKTEQRAEDSGRPAKEKSSGEGQASGDSGRSVQKSDAKKDATRLDERNGKKSTEVKTGERKEDAKPKSSSEGQASGESGRTVEKKDADRLGESSGEKSPEVKSGERKEDAKRVALSKDKQERIQTVFRERGEVKHRTNVNIDLRVGTRLPRDWDFVLVPDEVVVIVPEYRGYRFAYVDDYYVVCDPDTYEVVAVIPASRGPSYASDESHGRCPERLSLNEDERDLIMHSIRHERRDHIVDVPHLTLGWSVPRDIELQRFPEPVVSRVSELSSCRYFLAEDKIAVVSPEEEKVVALIDRS
jgi:hypothetical protein